jgi:hypothetical protein
MGWMNRVQFLAEAGKGFLLFTKPFSSPVGTRSSFAVGKVVEM